MGEYNADRPQKGPCFDQKYVKNLPIKCIKDVKLRKRIINRKSNKKKIKYFYIFDTKSGLRNQTKLLTFKKPAIGPREAIQMINETR